MNTYKIVMMNKHEIQIDEEEVSKVLKGIMNSSPVILKQGIFNPSTYSHIVEDRSRLFTEQKTNENGHYVGAATKCTELKDIFADIKEIAELKTLKLK